MVPEASAALNRRRRELDPPDLMPRRRIASMPQRLGQPGSDSSYRYGRGGAVIMTAEASSGHPSAMSFVMIWIGITTSAESSYQAD